MTADLRALLGDRYVSTLRAAVLADNPDAIASAQAVGGKLGQLMYLSAVDRLDRVLTAVLPALLAERDALAAKVEAVRALHYAEQHPRGFAYCVACDGDEFVPWPCPTVRALDGGE